MTESTENGLDLAAIKGSGPHGRIVKADIESALAGGAPAVAAPAPGPSVAPVPSAAPAAAVRNQPLRGSVIEGRYDTLLFAGHVQHSE